MLVRRGAHRTEVIHTPAAALTLLQNLPSFTRIVNVNYARPALIVRVLFLTVGAALLLWYVLNR